MTASVLNQNNKKEKSSNLRAGDRRKTVYCIFESILEQFIGHSAREQQRGVGWPQFGSWSVAPTFGYFPTMFSTGDVWEQIGGVTQAFSIHTC